MVRTIRDEIDPDRMLNTTARVLAEGFAAASCVTFRIDAEDNIHDEIQAAIGRGDRKFLCAAMALKPGFSAEVVQQVLTSQSPRTLVALCWKAGLSMRTAFQAQLKIVHIPAPDLISAKEGLHYPFGGAKMYEVLRLRSD